MTHALTQLEAINVVLGAADISPVTTIGTGTTLEATLALNILNHCQREVLNIGWHWNTDFEYSVPLHGATQQVHVPDDTLRFDPIENQSLVVRGDKVWDRVNHTFDIGSAVKGTMIWYLEWDELIEEAKFYITRKTARRFHEQHVGSGDALNSLMQDEREALRLMVDGDLDAGSYSLFDAPDMHAGLSYGNPYVGRAAFNSSDPFRSNLNG